MNLTSSEPMAREMLDRIRRQDPLQYVRVLIGSAKAQLSAVAQAFNDSSLTTVPGHATQLNADCTRAAIQDSGGAYQRARRVLDGLASSDTVDKQCRAALYAELDQLDRQYGEGATECIQTSELKSVKVSAIELSRLSLLLTLYPQGIGVRTYLSSRDPDTTIRTMTELNDLPPQRKERALQQLRPMLETLNIPEL